MKNFRFFDDTICNITLEPQELINLHWLPIRQRIDYKLLILVFKSVHYQAPIYISKLTHRSYQQSQTPFKLFRCTHIFRSSPTVQCHTIADRFFSCHAPCIWNSLPEHIKLADSLDTFKTLLKTHLFNIAHSQ